MKTTDACSLLDHRLETLLVLVEAGSFSAAARELYISQPAVSQQIKSLENDLDLALVKRCGKRVELTRAAYKLADYLSAFSLDSNKVMHRLRGEVEPPLKLGSTRSCGQFVLPQLMANLLEGGVRFIVKIANTEELMADIKSGDVDLALVEGNFDRASFGSFDIETVPFVGVLGKGIP